MSKPTVEKYLIEGSRPLVVIPELAEEIGLEPALILQQLHWLLRDPRNGKEIKGKRWIYNTYESWKLDYFPWMSYRTMQRCFLQLEKAGWIASCQPEGGVSRKKYYRVLIGGTSHVK